MPVQVTRQVSHMWLQAGMADIFDQHSAFTFLFSAGSADVRYVECPRWTEAQPERAELIETVQDAVRIGIRLEPR